MFTENPFKKPNVHAYAPDYRNLSLTSESPLERSFAITGHQTGLIKGAELKLQGKKKPAILKFASLEEMALALDLLNTKVQEHNKA